MLKDLLKEGGLYTIANFLTKGISLLLLPFYTSYFTTSDYGVLDLITVFGFFVTGISTLQLGQGLARYVAEPTNTEKEKISYASSAILGALIFLIFSYTLLVYFSDQVELILFDKPNNYKNLYIVALTSIYINTIFYLLGIYFRFTRKTKIYTLLSLSHALISITLTLLLLICYDLGIISIYIAYLIVVPILIIIQLYVLRKELKFKINKNKLKELLTYSIPTIPLGIAVVLMNFTDRLFIKYYFSFSELGIYGVSSKFTSFISVFIAGFTMAISPLILMKHNNKETKIELQKIFNLFISISTLAIICLSLFSYETVLLLISNPDYLNAYKVMPILYLTTLITGLQMFSPGLMIKKKTGLMAIITITYSIINIVLNYLLIPNYGLIGAAFATLIAVTGQQFTFFWFSQRLYPFKVEYVKMILFILILIIIVDISENLNFENIYKSIVIKLLIIISYLVLLIKSKTLDLQKFKTYLIKN